MSVPKGRSKDIETKARHSSFKTKLRNDHENHLLGLELEHLHNKTVCRLEEHWNSTMEVVNIFKGCNKTSGISPLGVRPTRSDMYGCLQNLHSKSTPWAHFGKFTIDSWNPSDDAVKESRPQTAHVSTQRTHTKGTRPKTAPVGIGEQMDADSGGESEKDTGPTAELSAKDRQRQLLQLQAKAATMTRSKFLDLDSTGPIYNRNLASAYREKPASSCGTPQPVRKIDVTLPKEDSDAQVEPTRGFYQATAAMPIGTDSWDLSCLRDQFKIHRDASYSQDNRTPMNRNLTNSFVNPGAMNKDDVTKYTASSKVKRDTKSAGHIADSKSVGTLSRASSRRTMFSDDIQQTPSKSKSRLNSRQSHNDESEDKAKEKAEYVEMLTRITRHPVVNHKKFKEPKFYLRPQERYKMDQRFLMKRYFFLQRQMNKNHENEAAILAKAGTALVVNTTFTRSARLKLLTALMTENDAQQQNQRRFGCDEAMRRKVDAFLRSVADFVKYSAPESTLVIMVPKPREEVVVRQKLLK